MPLVTLAAHAENSEVFPVGSVAVAVTNRPSGVATPSVVVKIALPLASVAIDASPRNASPSPFPDGSHEVFVKNCKR